MSSPPSSAPGPTIAPSPAALLLTKTRLQLSLGSTDETQIIGGVAPYGVTLSAPVASVRVDAATGVVSLATLANGSATLTIADAAGATATASLLVAPRAGFVPGNVEVSLVGNPTNDFVNAQIRAAIARAALPLPGARLAVGDADITGELHPGERLDARVRVHVDGGGRYVDVDGIANAHVVVDAAAASVPAALFYSDDPEKIRTDGVLFRGTLAASHPVRLYYYHQAATAGHEIAILLDAPGGARVQIVGQGAGPNAAVMFVGQSATFRYLDARARGAGVVLDIPVGAPVRVFTGDRPEASGDLVAGVLDLSLLEGDPVRISVVSVSAGTDLRALLNGAELPTDGKNRRGEYDLATVAPLTLGYRIGEAEPAPVTLGALASALPNERPGGHVLAGDYGLLRPLDLQLSNPGDTAATVYLYEQPIGFPVTTTIAFYGDPGPTRLQCVKNAANRYLVRAFSVPAGADERVTGSYMTDGGSTYPLSFGLSAIEPSAAPATMTAPDGCFPKPPAMPAAPATPAPSESPASSSAHRLGIASEPGISANR